MTTTKEQVLELVSSGKISANEGDELLKAIEAPRRSRWRLLINPVERLGMVQAMVMGASGAAAALLLSRWNVRFDGALDVHITPFAVSFREALAYQFVAWPLVALVLWATSRAFAPQGRVVDHLVNVGVARIPLLLVGAVAAAMRDQLPADPSQVASASPIALLVLVAFTIPAVIWTVTLLFQGFRTASGVRGAKGAVLFTVALVLAEVLSKVALHLAG